MRGRYRWASPFFLPTLLLMELGDPIMVPKELSGIKERAEALASQRRGLGRE